MLVPTRHSSSFDGSVYGPAKNTLWLPEGGPRKVRGRFCGYHKPFLLPQSPTRCPLYSQTMAHVTPATGNSAAAGWWCHNSSNEARSSQTLVNGGHRGKGMGLDCTEDSWALRSTQRRSPTNTRRPPPQGLKTSGLDFEAPSSILCIGYVLNPWECVQPVSDFLGGVFDGWSRWCLFLLD